MEPLYRSVVGVAVSIMKAMDWKVVVRGPENIPARGGAVIATNHVGYLDFVFVGYGARRQGRLVRFLAKKEVFDHKVAGPLMRGMKHIPVDRFGVPGASIEASVDALRRGEIIGLFPESTISRSFVPRAGRSGAARMALEAGVPLIPGAVWGSQRILTKGRPRNLQRHLTVTLDYDTPLEYEPDEDPALVTKRLMGRIEQLVDRVQRTYPEHPSDDGDRWWLPAHLGGSAPSVEQADDRAERDRRERSERRKGELG